MKFITFIKNSIISLYSSIRRFPVVIGLSTAAAISLMILTHNDRSFNDSTRELIGHIAMTLALGVPVSLCLTLISERSLNTNPALKAGLYLLCAIGLVLYHFFMLVDFEMVTVTRYIGVSLFFYIAFICIPYLLKRNGIELYFIKLLTRFFTTVIYSAVLYLGIAAVLFTIDRLLEIRINERVYLDVWMGVVGVFASSFFLAGVPLYKDEFENSTYPKLLKVLLLYIVMPLASVYTLILYIYFAKIIITLQWPVGLVAHLVLWYSVICTIITFLISPLYEESKWARTFTFLLSKLIIPLLLMMFLSIGIRVKAYGITENRYFVIALGLWALGIMIYINFKNRRNIIMLVSLSLVALLSVTGPWSSYSVSKLSQNKRLEGILQKNDMLKDSTIVKPVQVVSEEDKYEISQVLKYFSESHKLKDVRYLPKDFNLKQMNEVFGFPYKEFNDYGLKVKDSFSYGFNLMNRPVDIKGYDYMFSTNYSGQFRPNPGSVLEIKYDESNKDIIIYSKNKEVYRTSVKYIAEQIQKRYGFVNKYDFEPDELTFTDENANIKVKFIFNTINGFTNEYYVVEISNMSFYVLVSLK